MVVSILHKSGPVNLVIRLVVLAAIAVAAPAAVAFDTGHHCDLTCTVLREHGFGDEAIAVAVMGNWMTDYFAVSPTSTGSIQAELRKLHFDNLYGTAQVERYWRWLTANARAAIRVAAKDDDVMAALTVTGVLLHAGQDFYSHSNWVELHPRSPGEPYRTDTWLGAGPPTGRQCITGTYPPYPSPPPSPILAHGDSMRGLNKDSHVRPGWDEAYVFAYVATHELLGPLEQWAESERPGFWLKVRHYNLTETQRRQIRSDLEAVASLSMWTQGPGVDGRVEGARQWLRPVVCSPGLAVDLRLRLSLCGSDQGAPRPRGAGQTPLHQPCATSGSAVPAVSAPPPSHPGSHDLLGRDGGSG